MTMSRFKLQLVIIIFFKPILYFIKVLKLCQSLYFLSVLDNSLCYMSLVMFVYYCVLFIIKTWKNAVFSTPAYIRRHYGDSCVRGVRRLTHIKKRIMKSRHDIIFLQTCIIYNLVPKMSRFKLQLVIIIFFKPIIYSIKVLKLCQSL